VDVLKAAFRLYCHHRETQPVEAGAVTPEPASLRAQADAEFRRAITDGSKMVFPLNEKRKAEAEVRQSRRRVRLPKRPGT
jgi:hypothetical protein